MKLTIVIAAALLVLTVPHAAGAETGPERLAEEDAASRIGAIDLSQEWIEGKACWIADEGTTCFASERELNAALAEPVTQLETTAGTGSRTAATTALATTTCTVRLYAGTSYTSTVVAVTKRSSWVNLSIANFDNKTRSYKVTGCPARFAAGSWGSGSIYPGSTAAGAQAASMRTGWDKAVSSVYIY